MSLLTDLDIHEMVHCPGCGGTEMRSLGKPLMPVRVNLPIGTISIRNTIFTERELMECPRCRIRFYDRVVGPETQASIFNDESIVAGWAGESRVLVLRNRTIAAGRGTEGSDPVRILDVGCNTGQFLGSLPADWQRVGVEINPAAAKIARDRLPGTSIIEGSFLEMNDGSGSFDLITAWDLVEHIATPMNFRQKVVRLLKPGGYLLFETGDFSSCYSTIAGLSWWYYSILDHSVFYDPASMVNVFNASEMRILHAKPTVHPHRDDISRRQILAQRLKSALVVGYSFQGRVRSVHRATAAVLDKDGTVPNPCLSDHLFVTCRRI